MISILLPSYLRSDLLGLGLSSILANKPKSEYEIIVLNDGIEDDTENVCNIFRKRGLNIKYLFTGQRNADGVMKFRVPGFALNIGIKESKGDVIILSCPEMWHLNNAIDILGESLKQNPKGLVIPDSVYFDREGKETEKLRYSSIAYPKVNLDNIVGAEYARCHAEMPFLMAINKEPILEINGYSEEFTGYAGEDNDFINRLKRIGLQHVRTSAQVIHLYHGGSTDGGYHFENPAWVHNWNLLQRNNEANTIKVNLDKEWGII